MGVFGGGGHHSTYLAYLEAKGEAALPSLPLNSHLTRLGRGLYSIVIIDTAQCSEGIFPPILALY